MKNILSTIVLFLIISFAANAQTNVSTLFHKIKSAPVNEYGVQRVNYDVWDTTATATNTWAYFSKKDGFILCMSKGNELYYGIWMGPKENIDRAEKILAGMDPQKWYPECWGK